MDAHFEHLLSAVDAGPCQTFENLSMVPLLAPPNGPEVVTLGEALDAGTAEVVEVSESGRVNELSVINRGPRPLVLIHGQELVGAKQNRIVNASLLVAAGTEVAIPVSCVERGRWARRSRTFTCEGRSLPSFMRRSTLTRVGTSLRRTGTHDAGQGETWTEIDRYAHRTRVHSATSAMSDVIESERASLDRFREALRPAEGQVGAIAYIDGRLAGVDLMGRPETWRQLHDHFVLSYAAGAVHTRHQPQRHAPSSPAADPAATLSSITLGATSEYKSPGIGRDVRFESAEIQAALLMHDEGIVHIEAFPA